MVKKKEGDFQRFLFFHSFLLCLCKPLASELFAPQAIQLGKPWVISSWHHRDDSLLVTAPEYPAQGLKKKSKELFLQEAFSFLYCTVTLWDCLLRNWDDWNNCGKKEQWPKTPLCLPLLFCFSSLHIWAFLYMATPTCLTKTFLDSQDDKVRKYKAFVS